MPEIFRFFGFSFFFYSKEHEPIHIHVEGNDGMAKFDWDGEQFILVEKHNIKAGDMKKSKLLSTRMPTSSSLAGMNISTKQSI